VDCKAVVHAWEITDEQGLLEAEPGPQEAAPSILSPAQYPLFIYVPANEISKEKIVFICLSFS
jgi:hypothetical protein